MVLILVCLLVVYVKYLLWCVLGLLIVITWLYDLIALAVSVWIVIDLVFVY